MNGERKYEMKVDGVPQNLNDVNLTHTEENEINTSSSGNVAGNSSTSDNNTIREKCAYGQNCYRKNLQHKSKFSHPGDSDYNIVDTRPECPYGIRCYRKNLQHRKDYQHTRIRPRRQTTDDHLSFAQFFPSDEESVSESEFDPTDLLETSQEYDDDDEIDFDVEVDVEDDIMDPREIDVNNDDEIDFDLEVDVEDDVIDPREIDVNNDNEIDFDLEVDVEDDIMNPREIDVNNEVDLDDGEMYL